MAVNGCLLGFFDVDVNNKKKANGINAVTRLLLLRD
jgi:hypothetical protein